MNETVITVQGHFESRYPAERATVAVSVGFDGRTRSDVFDAATAIAADLTASLDSQLDREKGPVSWWASDQLRVWADRPWNDKGEQLPLVYHSSIGVRAEFRDFAALAEWVERVATGDGVTISGITWDLTDAKRNSVTAEARSRAVRDAVDKATVYAHSIGLTKVTAIAIADPGMLGDPGSTGPSPQFGRMALASAPKAYDSSGGGAGLSFTPEDIEVQALVDARFVAG